MGSGRITPIIPNLFSTASPREDPSSLPPVAPIPTPDNAASSPRHVLPSDLPAAIKHLNDQELEQLLAAVTAEQQRRGKKPPSRAKTPSKSPVEAVAVSLTPGKLSAVRAAFKAGVRPSKIAKQFGISQSDVRKVLANEKKASTCSFPNRNRSTLATPARRPLRILPPLPARAVRWMCSESGGCSSECLVDDGRAFRILPPLAAPDIISSGRPLGLHKT
jgi:predicted DNA-binding protein (UPF0251 family)